MSSPSPSSPSTIIVAVVTESEGGAAVPRAQQRVPANGRMLRHFGYFFGASVFAQIINMVRSFMIPFILAPAQLGVWNLMNVVIGYAPNAHLGLLHGMNKAIPRFRAQEEHEEADALRDSALWLTICLGALAGGATVVAAVLRPALTLPLVLTSAVVFLQLPYTFQFCLLRAESRFSTISQGLVVLAVLSTVLVVGIGTTSSDHLVGGLVGLILAWLTTTVFLFVRAGYSYRLRVSWRLIRTAFMVGAPLAVITTADTMFMSLDRWVIAGFFGREELGYYALGVMASGVLSFVPNSLFQVMFPVLIGKYARTGDPRSLGEVFRTAMIGISSVMLVLVVVAALAIEVFIELALPAYGPAVPLAKLLIAGSFFLSLAWISNGFIVAIDRQRVIIGLQIAAAVVGLSVDFVLVRGGAGVLGVAVGAVVSYGVLGIGALLLAGRAVLPRTSDALRLVSSLVMPFVAAMTVLYAAQGVRSNVTNVTSVLGVIVVRAVTIFACLAAAGVVAAYTHSTKATLRSFAVMLRDALRPEANESP